MFAALFSTGEGFAAALFFDGGGIPSPELALRIKGLSSLSALGSYWAAEGP